MEKAGEAVQAVKMAGEVWKLENEKSLEFRPPYRHRAAARRRQYRLAMVAAISWPAGRAFFRGGRGRESKMRE